MPQACVLVHSAEIPERAHEDGLLVHVGIGPLESPRHVQHRLQVSQPVVVVVLHDKVGVEVDSFRRFEVEAIVEKSVWHLTFWLNARHHPTNNISARVTYILSTTVLDVQLEGE